MKLLIELDEEYVKVIDKLKFLVGGRTDRKLQLEIIKAIKNGKALEQEPKTGEWIEQNDDYFDWYECSECGYGSEGEMQYSSEYDVRTNYCPNCGAKMESEDKE